MPKFRVRLESQTDDQAREVTLSRATEDEARQACEMTELEYCQTKLDSDELDALRANHSFNARTGKASGPTARGRGQLAVHHQSKPYLITSVEKVGR